jgi:branched-chain amino acid transport system ATP-binding protein
MLLEIENLHVAYGSLVVLHGMNLRIDEGQVVCVIGNNGAGKTSLLRGVSGITKVVKGDIRFRGLSITNHAPHKISGMGLAHVPQGRRIFSRMTVYENLEMGGYRKQDAPLFQKQLDRVLELFPELGGRKQQLGGTLSGGEQQMLALGRALMSSPELLLLDEPSLGLAPLVVNRIMNAVRAIGEMGTAILLVEQNAKKALSVAQYCYILDHGSIIAEGTSDTLAENDSIMAAYLGRKKK